MDSTPVAEAVVGRRRERALIARLLEEARVGRPGVVLVEGPAGIGKSTLLALTTAELEPGHAALLRASCDETESGLHLGVVGQLVTGLSPRPDSLSASGGLHRELDPIAAGAGLLELVGELQAQRGLVVVAVDDAHWADSASLHALGFCLRRLRTERVLALLTARSEELGRLPSSITGLATGVTGMTLSLPGLGAGDLAQLAPALGVGDLSPRAAERLAAHTNGNPLLAVALLQELGAAFIARPEGLESHAPRSFASVVLARLAACGPRGRDLAAAGSVLGLRWPLALAAGLAGVDDPLAAADEAAAATLVTVARESTGLVGAFPHPLVRAALYQELSLSTRIALHRRAAELVDDPREALRHRVEGEVGPNPQLFDELTAAAERDAAGGSWAAAARAHLSAARVAADREQHERQVLDAVVCLLLAGDVADARALLDGDDDFADGAAVRFARGYLAWTDGAFIQAEQQLRGAWELADTAADRELAARTADLLSSLCVYLGRGAEGITWARRSLEVDVRSPPGANPRTSMLVGYGISGRTAEGLAAAAGFDLEDADLRPADGLVGRGTVRLWADDPVGARHDLLPVAEGCLRRGPLDLGMFAGVHVVDAEWRLGLWDEALTHAEAAVSAAAVAAHGWFLAQAHAAAALPLVSRGRWEGAQTHVRGAVEAARRIGYGHGSLWAIVARGRMADARGDPEGVVSALTALLPFVSADGVDHPGIHPWRELLGVALLALGRVDEAAAHADALETQGRRLNLPSARARALRVRGLCEASWGSQDKAIHHLERALAELDGLPQPFDRAVIEADLGGVLRRAGRRRAAVTRLERAAATLARLGATPYLDRVERDLSACGLHPVRDRMDTRERLTPAELSVARLVAQGKTNREVAAELVVSPKTVEHHLSRIYQKLGVSSRTQLAVRLAAEA